MKIFVVEDNDWYGRLIKHNLELNPDHIVSYFPDGDSALKALSDSPDIVTLDYRLPDTTGMELLKKIKTQKPNTEVIIISEQEEIGTAVELLKLGASDYIEKSKDMRDRLLHSVETIKKHRKLVKRVEELEEEVGKKYDFSSIMAGESEALKRVFNLIGKAAKTDINVIVTGETGTGKELVSRAIHYNSGYSKGPFVAINVAAIPSELIESELFGHEKGSFTGAHQTRIGKFEQASGGTLLLDEIGEMDLNMQAKLLRVLQEREFAKVGSNKNVKLNCRIVAATHKNLVDEVKNGKFREDLYYRLYGITIALPPLRDRGSDVVLLAEKFVDEYCVAQKMSPKKLSKEAKRKLLNYNFPGNIRELKSVIELAATMSEGSEIVEDDIQFPEIPLESKLFSNSHTMREYQLMIINHYLEANNDDVMTVAEILDIGKSTIYRMLKEE
ncbi:MAG: sigma-54 dependent transcriptional regulator [Flavobacteriales bacterium]